MKQCQALKIAKSFEFRTITARLQYAPESTMICLHRLVALARCSGPRSIRFCLWACVRFTLSYADLCNFGDAKNGWRAERLCPEPEQLPGKDHDQEKI